MTVRLTPINDGITLTFESLPEPTSLDVYSLAQQFLPDADLTPPNPPRDDIGDSRTFFAYNLGANARNEIDTVLCASTEHIDFYLAHGIGFTCSAFRNNAHLRTEEIVRPSVVARFAGDLNSARELRIAIVHADLPGFGGYFDASELYPTDINPYASGRRAIFLNAADGRDGIPGAAGYDTLVAHELQHAIHQLSDPDESTWVNEGLSVLAEDIIFSTTRAYFFLNSCLPTQIITWPSTPGAAACNYAGAGLFMRYLYENYPGPDGTLRQLVAQPANGLRGIDAYLTAISAGIDVLEVMADWGVANYIDGRSNLDFYINLEARATPKSQLNRNGELSKSFTQFAAQYVALPLDPGSYTIEFQGNTTTPLLSRQEEVSGSFWHAGSEDSAAYSLTREFDLRSTDQSDDATLTLLLRYHTEENWDYLYATVSTDGGQTWQVLRSPGMQDTSEIAVGSAMFPAGFTGISGSATQPQWLLEELDLSDFVGEQILFRLLYLTDQSISLDGVSLGGAWLPAADYGWTAIDHPIPIPLAEMTTNSEPDGGWTPDGFVFSNNRVQQDYAVRLITVSATGETTVASMFIDENSHGTLAFDNSAGDITDAAIMVMPFAPQTRQPAHATLTVQPCRPKRDSVSEKGNNPHMDRAKLIAVIGGAAPPSSALTAAEEVGKLLAERGMGVVCGGLSGVMEAVCKGAYNAGGLTVGLLPSYREADANQYVKVSIPTGIGYVRNSMVVRAGRAVIAIDGSYGTLNEMSFALAEQIPVVALDSWEFASGGTT